MSALDCWGSCCSCRLDMFLMTSQAGHVWFRSLIEALFHSPSALAAACCSSSCRRSRQQLQLQFEFVIQVHFLRGCSREAPELDQSRTVALSGFPGPLSGWHVAERSVVPDSS